MKKRKIKKRYLIPAIILILLLAYAIYYFEFTTFGYRMTVPYRNFTEIQKDVYVENGYPGDVDEVRSIINEASARVSDFWGDTRSNPVIIISYNNKTIKKLGGEKDTSTAVFFRAYSYISVSEEYLNVDILSHEMTHAELHERLYKGKIKTPEFPLWFDEGVATQNDYREKYSDEQWVKYTDNGSNMIELDDMDTPDEFYAGDVKDRILRYTISRHEVKSWIQKNGIDEFFELIERVNKGDDFYELYDHGNQ